MFKSLYIHFPFCESKCHYCDFYSLGRERTGKDDPAKFEKALNIEISQSSPAPELETIFFGGGTPTMTSFDSMKRALEPLWKVTGPTADIEWTTEANPSSVEENAARSLFQYGINRVSLGVQALRPDLLEALGRVHSGPAVFKALETLFKVGFENISVDLLCGVPNQSLQDVEQALEALTRFPITHLSCYLLTLPKHHKMYPLLPNDEIQLEHLLFVHNWMVAHGFEHYEISNYCKPGMQARHNLNYWNGKSYLGYGPSAHSYDASTNRRWKNVSSLHKYAQLLDQGLSVIEWTETLTENQIKLEQWMLALRLSDGFPLEWLRRPDQLAKSKVFEEQGLLETHPQLVGRKRLTPRGFALSDHVIKALA